MAHSLAHSGQRDAHYQQLVRDVELLRAELGKKSNASNDELAANKNLVAKLQADNNEINKAYRDVVASKETLEKEFNDSKVFLFIFKILLLNLFVFILVVCFS